MSSNTFDFSISAGFSSLAVMLFAAGAQALSSGDSSLFNHVANNAPNYGISGFVLGASSTGFAVLSNTGADDTRALKERLLSVFSGAAVGAGGSGSGGYLLTLYESDILRFIGDLGLG